MEKPDVPHTIEVKGSRMAAFVQLKPDLSNDLVGTHPRTQGGFRTACQVSKARVSHRPALGVQDEKVAPLNMSEVSGMGVGGRGRGTSPCSSPCTVVSSVFKMG